MGPFPKILTTLGQNPKTSRNMRLYLNLKSGWCEDIMTPQVGPWRISQISSTPTHPKYAYPHLGRPSAPRAHPYPQAYPTGLRRPSDPHSPIGLDTHA